MTSCYRTHLRPGRPVGATDVVLHPQFLLVRVFDNAEPARGSGCRYPGLNPARSTRPQFRPALTVQLEDDRELERVSDDEEQIAWARETAAAIEPWSVTGG